MHAKTLLIGTILLAVGLLLLLLFLIMLVRRITYYSRSHKMKRPPLGVSYIAIFLAALLLVLSWGFFAFSNNLKQFLPYAPGQKAALIDITRTGDPIKTLRIIIYWVRGDSLKENPEFFLSGDTWYLKGRLIEVSGYIGKMFPAQWGIALDEMHGDFTEGESVNPDKTIFSHHVFEEGATDLAPYVKFIGLIGGSFKANEFATPPILSRAHERYWLTISDSGAVSLDIVQ
jgi:hypothetical protein